MSYMNEASFFHGYKVFYCNSDGSSGSTIFGDPISSEENEDPISVVILLFSLAYPDRVILYISPGYFPN